MEERNPDLGLKEAQSILQQLAAAFPLVNTVTVPSIAATHDENLPESDARYQTLIEQIPAVVFMAFLDKGIGEAYVSPQIEAILGYTQEEWLNDPVRWYQKIHPDDKDRWSGEAAELFFSAGVTQGMPVSRGGEAGRSSATRSEAVASCTRWWHS